jgi:thiol-disulfide isomerase/thioredoxin
MKSVSLKGWLLSIACGLLLPTYVCSQEYPKIGKPMPEFTLHKITNYDKKQASLKDFRGKWLILDFWSKGCGSCIASFPKMNALQQEFKDSVQLIFIGITSGHWGKDIESLYEAMKKRKNFNMATAWDSTLDKKWGAYTLPHIITVDPKGIVRAVSVSMDKENLQALMAGKEHSLRYKTNYFEDLVSVDPVNLYKPFYSKGNVSDDNDFEYRSILSKFDMSIPEMRRHITPTILMYKFDTSALSKREAYWQGTGVTVEQLYKLAYAGYTDFFDNYPTYKNDYNPYLVFFQKLVLEIKDSSLFKDVFKGKSENVYNYSIFMPRENATRESMQYQVQCDLKKYFPFEATVETRLMPYYKVIATDAAKVNLKTKGGDYVKDTKTDGYSSIKYVNATMETIMYHIESVYNDSLQTYTFFDETGIKGNIDLNIDVPLDDIEGVKKVLRKNGLDAVIAYKEMKVIVIRDRKSGK